MSPLPFRLSVSDVVTNSLNELFSFVILCLNVVRDDGGNICEAFEAILLGEEGTARRMPSDAEFERALRTRDCYAFKRSFYLLAALENSWHAKDPLDFSGGTSTNCARPFRCRSSHVYRQRSGI